MPSDWCLAAAGVRAMVHLPQKQVPISPANAMRLQYWTQLASIHLVNQVAK